MDGADLELFSRGVRHATEHSSGADLDAALDELGWGDALSDDPQAAVSVLFEHQGWAKAASAALDHVLAHCLGAAGPQDCAVVLPPLGGWGAPAQLTGESLVVRGLGTAALARRRRALVVAGLGHADALVTVSATDLDLRPIGGADPGLGLVEVRATVPAGELRAAPEWPEAVAVARRALAHELVGAARRMLELARAHALERVQFGQPISSFQAVRHRLAETLLAIEAADAMLEAAWHDGEPRTAAMAKAVAGRGARTAARHCQQVLAGIGFTTEHPFHRYLRRVLVLDHLFGPARVLTRELGEDVLRARQLPPLPPL
jgi:hypothetical protein